FARPVDIASAPNGAGGPTDIGAYERQLNVPPAAFASAPPVNNTNYTTPTYSFTVTYLGNGAAIDTATIDANDVTIGRPAGVPAVTIQPVAAGDVNASDPQAVVVTYRFTAPGGAWDSTDNGTYTVNLAANQV